MRRRLLLALCALAIVAAIPVRAQDARSSEAQDAARAWLAAVDDGAADVAYDTAGAKFKRGLTKAQWVKALGDTRKSYGANTRRTIVSTQFHDRLRGVGKGDFAVLQFRSVFANRDFAQEVVTVEKTPQGWRVVGYIIR
jgi:hypothetical protein